MERQQPINHPSKTVDMTINPQTMGVYFARHVSSRYGQCSHVPIIPDKNSGCIFSAIQIHLKCRAEELKLVFRVPRTSIRSENEDRDRKTEPGSYP